MDTTPPTHPQVDPPVLGEHAGHVVYPMPVFARVATPDPARLVTFFTTALDFAVMFTGPEIDGIPMLVHLRRAKYQDVLVVPAPSAGAAGTGAAPAGPAGSPGLVVTFQAGEAADIDRLAERIAGTAPDSLDGPLDTPWLTRELTVRDPDGRPWTFSARGRAPVPGTIDATMERARAGAAG